MSTTEPDCEKGMEEDAVGGIAVDVGVSALGGVESESASEVLSRMEVAGSCSRVSLAMPESLSEPPQLAASKPMAASRLAKRMRFGSALCVAVVIYP